MHLKYKCSDSGDNENSCLYVTVRWKNTACFYLKRHQPHGENVYVCVRVCIQTLHFKVGKGIGDILAFPRSISNSEVDSEVLTEEMVVGVLPKLCSLETYFHCIKLNICIYNDMVRYNDMYIYITIWLRGQI